MGMSLSKYIHVMNTEYFTNMFMNINFYLSQNTWAAAILTDKSVGADNRRDNPMSEKNSFVIVKMVIYILKRF